MAGFYLTAEVLGYLAQLILTLGLTLYLASLPQKSRPTWLLLAFFACMAGYAVISLVEGSTLWVGRFYAVHGQIILIALALIPLLQFAYAFPEQPPTPRARLEARFVLGLSLLVAGRMLAWARYQFGQLTPIGDPTTNTTLGDSWLALGFLWVTLTFWRRALALSRSHDGGQPWWRHLLRPQGRPAQAAATFALGLTVAAGISLLALLDVGLNFLSQGTFDVIPSLGVLVCLFLLAVVYFNHSPQPTSFLVKLVGISLVTNLLIIGLAATLLTPPDVRNQGSHLAFTPRPLRFEPTPAGGYTLTTPPARFDTDWGEAREEGYQPLPFTFPLFGRSWERLFLSHEMRLIFGETNVAAHRYNLRPILFALDIPYSAALPNEMFVKEEPERYTVTWRLPPDDAGEPSTVVQIALERGGAVELRYQHVDRARVRRVGVQSGNGEPPATTLRLDARYQQAPVPSGGLVADFVLAQHLTVHRALRPLFFLTVAGSLFILLAFPLFFRTFLIQPLNALVGGVRAVNEGNLSVQVPLRFPDEIGLVTQTFNRMVDSVREADERLEGQVAARTQELTASEARFRGLASSSLEALLLHEQGLILDANEAAQQLFGYPHAALVGMSLYDLLAPDSHSLMAQQVAHRAQEPYEVRGRAQDGTLLPLEVRVREVPYGSRRAQVLVARNLADRKQLEAQKQQVAALEERARIGRELHDDLGQVMGYISVQVQTAQALLRQGNSAQALAALGQLEESSQAAHHELRQYILGVRTSRSQPPPDFAAALDGYLEQVRERYGLTVQASIPPDLRASPLAPEVETQLLRIIQEGLTNIHKHAGVSRASLLLTLHEQEIQVVISDEGTGFMPDEPRDREGHFGLAIMRERAESVGGTLELRSAPGRGTQLIVRLPRRWDGPEEEMVRGLRVLLVDDHPLYVEGLRNLLATRGVQVVGVAHDGIEAQSLARSLQPDLILMDVEMPQRDGLEATARIKAEQPQIKIVMLTMAARGETLLEALRRGASGYLLKSLEGAQFFQMLREVMRGETVLSPQLAAEVLENLTVEAQPEPAAPNLPADLSERQVEVLMLVSQGLRNRDIAERLHITERTVKFHVGQILERLHLRSRHELARYAPPASRPPDDTPSP